MSDPWARGNGHEWHMVPDPVWRLPSDPAWQRIVACSRCGAAAFVPPDWDADDMSSMSASCDEYVASAVLGS